MQRHSTTIYPLGSGGMMTVTARVLVLIITLAAFWSIIIGVVNRFGIGVLSKSPMLAYVVINTTTEQHPVGELRFFDPSHDQTFSYSFSEIFHSIDGITWSPDGQRLAIMGDGKLHTLSPLSGELVTVREISRSSWSPRWSPDGEWLTFLGHQQDVFILPMIGTTAHLRAAKPQAAAREDNQSRHASTRYDVDSGLVLSLDEGQIALRNATISPDGAWYAVSWTLHNTIGRMGITVVSADRSTQLEIQTSGSWLTPPMWRP